MEAPPFLRALSIPYVLGQAIRFFARFKKLNQVCTALLYFLRVVIVQQHFGAADTTPTLDGLRIRRRPAVQPHHLLKCRKPLSGRIPHCLAAWHHGLWEIVDSFVNGDGLQERELGQNRLAYVPKATIDDEVVADAYEYDALA